MMTAEQLEKIERHSHPKTSDGKTIRRLVAEVRDWARDYERQGEALRRERAWREALVAGFERLGYTAELVTGGGVMQVSLKPISPMIPGTYEHTIPVEATEDGAP